MAKVISRRNHVVVTSYTRMFQLRGAKSAQGFAFDCDAEGTVFEDKLNPCALANFRMCLMSSEQYEDCGVAERQHRWTEPAVIECENSTCKAHVSLSRFTNTCECGADYNMSGSLLADRSQWGEETGESVSDILQADVDREWG